MVAAPGGAVSAPAGPVARRTAVAVGTGVAILAALGALWIARTMVLLLFAGVLLALLLRTSANAVSSRTKLPPPWSLAALTLLLALLLAAGIWLRGPDVAAQVEQLQLRLPQAAHTVATKLRATEWGRELLARATAAQLIPSPASLFASATGIVSSTFAVIAGVVVIVFTGFYLAADPATYVEGVVRLFPLDRRARARAVLAELATVLRWWLLARVISMVVVGTLVTIGLRVLGVPLAFTLGPLAALLTFIPNIGPILSAAPPILLALSIDPRLAIPVALLFWGVHAAEGMFLTPIVEQRTVKLPPVLTLSAQVLLAVLVGAIGVALAAPLTAVGMVLVRRFYVEDALGDRASLPGTRRIA